jgi:aminopeptidase N
MISLCLSLLGLAGPPDRPGDVIQPRTWDIEHLHLDVKVDIENRRVSGVATHTIAPLPSSQATFRLHQVDLTIQEVRVDGSPVTDWRTRPGWLEIPVTKGVRHQVSIRYTAEPETGLHFRRRVTGERYDEAWTQGENTDHRYWFPGWDDPSDRFTVHVDVTAREGLTAFANGTLAERVATEPGWVRWSYRLDQQIVNYLVAVVVGEYRTWPVPGPGAPVETLAGVPISEAIARAGTDPVRRMLPWMEALVGTPYPYPVYRQAVVQGFLYGGMENTTLTTLSDELLAEEAWEDADRMEHVVAHELAHQWFGDLLTCYGWRELWLNEGFATYVTHRWWEESRGALYAAVDARQNVESATWQSRPMAPRSWSKSGDSGAEGVYNRGSSFLRFLEHHLGREVFDAGVRHYVQVHKDRLVESDDLRRALEDISGTDLGWAFDQWVYQGGAPTIKIRSSWRPSAEPDPATLDITAQVVGDRAWVVPLDVEVGTAAGIVRRSFWLTGPQSTLKLDLAEAPLWVVVDPQRVVIGKLEQEQSTTAWAQAAASSPTPGVRLEALEQLGQKPQTEESLTTLRSVALDGELPVPVRLLAADSLGSLRTPEATAVLIELASDPAPKVRAGGLQELGRVVTRDPVVSALRAAFRDPDPRVRAAALGALAKHGRESAVQEARRILGKARPGQADPERMEAQRILGEAGTLRDLPVLLAAFAERERRAIRLAAVRAAADLVDRIDEASGRATFSKKAAPLLLDEDQTVRAGAIRPLRQAGDESAARELLAFAASTSLDQHAEWAKDAASAIRARKRGDPVPPPPDDLKRLEERLEAFEKRLRELEHWR